MVGDNGWSGDPQGEASSLARLAALHGGCSCRRCPSSMGGGWLKVVLWAVRTRRWGRGPAGRGLTLGREPSISRL